MAKKEKKPKPRQIDLIEGRELKDIEDAALSYAENRDERMNALKEEVDLKKKLIDLMHKHKLNTYRHNGINIDLVAEKEKVKVKIKKDDPIEALDKAGE